MLNINNMKNTFLRYQSALFIATTVTATVVAPTSSQAFELTFSSLNVLSGIKGVSFTLPSTGKTKTYNVTLEIGTLGAASTLKRKLKPSKSAEKELEKAS
jgi:spore coat protein U-like protein